MAKFCSSCTWWSGVIFSRVDQQFGICSQPVASVNMLQDSAAKINEDSTVYTGSRFGCVYCEPKQQRFLIDINKTISK